MNKDTHFQYVGPYRDTGISVRDFKRFLGWRFIYTSNFSVKVRACRGRGGGGGSNGNLI